VVRFFFLGCPCVDAAGFLHFLTQDDGSNDMTWLLTLRSDALRSRPEVSGDVTGPGILLTQASFHGQNKACRGLRFCSFHHVCLYVCFAHGAVAAQ
jgi:hypothetical protein